MVYVDIQNLYNFKADEQDLYINEDENGNETVLNPDASPEDQQYVLNKIDSQGSGTILPTIGIIVEF
ncbi:MAG: hypothetical protein HC896_14640 [Bacteroidales bacterium]|nr:hypothetical protein [Bacteroidales bacterium]